MWFALALSLFYGSYNATVIEVVDAQTLKLDVAIWPGEQKTVNIGVLGVVTPSPNGQCDAEKLLAREAIELTRHFIGERVVLADVRMSKSDQPDDKQLYYANVRNKRGGLLSHALIEVGYGVPHEEDKQAIWCPEIP